MTLTLFNRADDLATIFSILVAAGHIQPDESSPLDEIMLKTQSNMYGATILSMLGVPLELPSRSASISSNESTQQARVYTVL